MTAQPDQHSPAFERLVIGLICAVQFVNVLEFMMVMPLGPDFSRALGIPTSNLGLISGCYTAAAAFSGVFSAMIVERYARRTALTAAMLGLGLATIACGLAQDMTSLMIARLFSGLFGGPSLSLALAIVADVIPADRRGRAISMVMAAFSVASIIGVPFGLEVARWGGWRASFFVVAALILGVVLIVRKWLPPLRDHLNSSHLGNKNSLLEFFKRPVVATSSFTTVAVMIGPFMLIPNMATYVQFNLGYPREKLGLLYLIAGILSLLTMRVTGVLVDRIGAFRVGSLGTLLMVISLYFSFIDSKYQWSPILIYAAFMAAMALRNVPFQTLSSKVPRPFERARFMALQSAIQHLATAVGAVIGSQMLTERLDHGLDGMNNVALFVIISSSLLPLLLLGIERLLMHEAKTQPSS